MNDMTFFTTLSTVGALFAIALGVFFPAMAMGKAISQALDAIARQPEAEKSISRLLFIGLAMIESAGHLRAGCGADRAVPQPAARIHAQADTRPCNWTGPPSCPDRQLRGAGVAAQALPVPARDGRHRPSPRGIEKALADAREAEAHAESLRQDYERKLAEQDKTHAAEMSRLNDEVAAERAPHGQARCRARQRT